MATFKVFYADEAENFSEHAVEVDGFDHTNWRDDEFSDALFDAFDKQHPGLDWEYIDDWWPIHGNEDFSHLKEA